MKNIFKLLMPLLVLSMSLAFTACGNDEPKLDNSSDDYPDYLIGTWQAKNYDVTPTQTYTLELMSFGKLFYSESVNDVVIGATSGSWSYSNGKVTLKNSNGTDVLTYKDGELIGGNNLHFKRIYK